MTLSVVTTPSEYFANSDIGKPISNGFIYIGEPDTVPEDNPIDVYALMEDGTQVLMAQPIRTGAGGVPVYNGSPVIRLLCESPYSIKVLDNLSTEKYYIPITDGNTVLSRTNIIKYNPSGLTEGQTIISVPDAPSALNVYIGDAMLLQTEGEYNYIENSGSITLATGLTAQNITDGVEIQYGEVASGTIGNEPLPEGHYSTVAVMAAASIEIGAIVHTQGWHVPGVGGASYIVKSAVDYPTPNGQDEIELANGNVAVLVITGELLIEQFGASTNTNIDSRPAIQAAIERAQENKAIGKKGTVTSLGGRYLIKTIYPDPLPTHADGKKVGLWLEDAEFCILNLRGGRVMLDVNSSAVEGIDEVLCICQESGDQAFVSIQESDFHGGIWADIANEPDYTVRMDYNVVKYSSLVNSKFYYAKESNLKIAGFVVYMERMDCRFAQNQANYEIVVTTVDGDGATRTGYLLNNCTSNWSGLYGFQISGGNGHTYCALNTCTADHAGRDRDNNTVNPTTSAAYRVSAGFGITMTSCGAEFSTRYARLNGARGLHIDTAYAADMGSTDGTTIDGLIEAEGFCEDVRIKGFRVGTLTDINKKLKITTPAGFNNGQFELDNSILDSDIEVDITSNDSSAPFLIGRLEDNWARGVRNPGGDALLVGCPSLGRESSDWFDQDTYAAKKHFRFETDDVTDLSEALLTLTNSANNGYIGFEVEVLVGRAAGSVAYKPSRYIATAGKAAGAAVVSGFDKVNASGDSVTLTLAWSGDDLVIGCETNFICLLVSVTAIGRQAAAAQTFDWLVQ